MPGFSIPPRAVVNQIKSNLHDRYDSGYPILKELLQNADDAKSRRFRLDAYSGWPAADNPLLQGPGLLVANDGAFSKDDQHGILSFGESGKAAEPSAIGKFGLGQKAVFHLCDAFVIHVVGVDAPFSKVVNPFLDVDIRGNVTSSWECLSDTDAALLSDRAGRDFHERALILWLPFRREHLLPAPGAGFSTLQPDTDTIIEDLARTDDLRVLLTALRHLESIEIRRHGKTICSVHVDKAQERLRGPQHDRPCTRSFLGTIDTGSGRSSTFIGRETTARDDRLERLRCSEHWPKTFSALHPEPTREKGDQHGAATLLRARNDEDQTNELRIGWAVFLPISGTEDEVLPIDADVGKIHLLLHGYFFLDSGRRHIEGLADPVSPDEPADDSALRSAWNTQLRDTVVLPLIPALLKEGLDHDLINATDLVHLARCIAACDWFDRYRAAICKKNALVRVLEGRPQAPAKTVAWRLVPADAALRPLPAILASRPDLIDRLFDQIDRWADAHHHITLCIDHDTSLTPRPMQWSPDELDSLFATLSRRAFQSESPAMLLNHFLTNLTADQRTKVAPHMVNALRAAMLDTPRLAPSSQIKNLLAHIPASRFFALHLSVNRKILRSLAHASSDAALLPVRSDWLEAHDQPIPSETDIYKLLAALEPFIGGNDKRLAEQAQTAALALAGHDIGGLAKLPDFRNVKILRADDPVTHEIAVLSFAELLAHAKQNSLFQPIPDIENSLRTLHGALPQFRPLIVYAAQRGSLPGIQNLTRTVTKDVFHVIINAQRFFGSPDARARLIERLVSLTGDDDTDSLAKLCGGDPNASAPAAKLWNAEHMPAELQRIIKKLLVERRPDEFLVPSSCVAVLTPKKRQLIGITDMDVPVLERLIDDGIEMVRAMSTTASERLAFLKTDLPDRLLRRLPIHDRSDGNVGTADDLFREDRWPVPDRLRHRVTTIRLNDDPQIQPRQKQITRVWSPKEQIDTALSAKDAHAYQKEVLHALSCLNNKELGSDLKERLRNVRWVTVGGKSLAPNDVLNLPPMVEQAATPYFRDSESFVFAHQLPERARDLLANADIIRDQTYSFDALTRMIDKIRLQARLGTMTDYPIRQFTALAKMGVDLKLSGWPLLASLLSSIEDDPERLQAVECFTKVAESESKIAGEHLDALGVAAENQVHPNPAKEAYHHGFKAIAQWSVAARHEALANTRVPTKSGQWRHATEVVAEDTGVSPAHVLKDAYATLLPDQSDPIDHAEKRQDVGGPAEYDLSVLQHDSYTRHRDFLEEWRGKVPADLVYIYLRIAGLARYAAEWTGDSTLDIEKEFDKLALDNPKTLVSLRKVEGTTVEVIALAGNRFRAPLCEDVSSLIVQSRKYAILPRGHTRRTTVVELQVRAADEVLADSDAMKLFRQFVAKVAEKCLSHELMDDLGSLLDRAAHVDQATLEDTRRLLQDRLPTLLAALKLPEGSAALEALRRYETQEARFDDRSLPGPKKELWDSILEPNKAAEVLDAVRDRIQDQGYSSSRSVLFELFQNADDAYEQRGSVLAGACFRIDFREDGFRIAHWGRPINYLGSNPQDGRGRGYDRDLLNMLMMGISEKRPKDGVTGKFGLGFKCVHLLSDSVGVASGFVALRTVGGLLPERWPEGRHQAHGLRRDLGTATVIDVPYTTEQMAGTARQVRAFLDAMAWLPAFSRRVRRIEVGGTKQDSVDFRALAVPGSSSIDVVEVQSASGQTQRAMRLNLEGGYSLLLKLGSDGFHCFDSTLGRLWNLAPLEEDVCSGWLLHGPFPVDPGRARLAGTVEDRQERFRYLGEALTHRLVELYDLVKEDWGTLARVMFGSPNDMQTPCRFWSTLFDVLIRDIADDLTRCLHAADRGYGYLVAQHPVVPTGLRSPFDVLVTASSVKYYADKALAEARILDAAREWRSTRQLKNEIVHAKVANSLRRSGFDHIRPITLSKLLGDEMTEEERRIDADLGARLGRVITQDAIEKEPLLQERTEILETARQAHFLAQDGTWRPVRALSSKHGGDDELLLCDFAPDHALLHQDYRDESLEFFKVARRRSGYSPGVPLLQEWINAAHDEGRRRAALRYLVTGQQGSRLAQSLRDDPPTWIDDVRKRFESHPLLEGWTPEARMKLIFELDLELLEVRSPPNVNDAWNPASISCVLEKLHEWWMDAREPQAARYSEKVYPRMLDTSLLVKMPMDRVAWFTMLALACFQLFGRTQDEQHRSFIEPGWREGWWAELSESEPPECVQPWLDRLDSWSSPERFEETYHLWERTLVDLYAIARGLDVYVELIRKFPQFVNDQPGLPSMDNVFRPSESLLAQGLGLNAAPISRTLGIGANWLMRELSRNGVYSASEAELIAPYCWAPSQRVRTTLKPWLELKADKGESPRIHDFVIEHLDAERAQFGGDYDLPLQIVTQSPLRVHLLNRWFEQAGLDAPEFGDESTDDEIGSS